MVVFVPFCPFINVLSKVVVFPWTWWVVAGELAPPGRYLHAAAASILPAALSSSGLRSHSGALLANRRGRCSGRRWHQIAQQGAQTRIMPAGKLLGGSNWQPLLEI